MSEKINLYLNNDMCCCPEGFVLAMTADQARYYLENFQIGILSIEHDFGVNEQENELSSGYDFVKYISENGFEVDKIYIHTHNFMGRENMHHKMLVAQNRG